MCMQMFTVNCLKRTDQPPAKHDFILFELMCLYCNDVRYGFKNYFPAVRNTIFKFVHVYFIAIHSRHLLIGYIRVNICDVQIVEGTENYYV